MRCANTGAASTAMSSAPTRRVCCVRQACGPEEDRKNTYRRIFMSSLTFAVHDGLVFLSRRMNIKANITMMARPGIALRAAVQESTKSHPEVFTVDEVDTRSGTEKESGQF